MKNKCRLIFPDHFHANRIFPWQLSFSTIMSIPISSFIRMKTVKCTEHWTHCHSHWRCCWLDRVLIEKHPCEESWWESSNQKRGKRMKRIYQPSVSSMNELQSSNKLSRLRWKINRKTSNRNVVWFSISQPYECSHLAWCVYIFHDLCHPEFEFHFHGSKVIPSYNLVMRDGDGCGDFQFGNFFFIHSPISPSTFNKHQKYTPQRKHSEDKKSDVWSTKIDKLSSMEKFSQCEKKSERSNKCNSYSIEKRIENLKPIDNLIRQHNEKLMKGEEFSRPIGLRWNSLKHWKLINLWTQLAELGSWMESIESIILSVHFYCFLAQLRGESD